MSPTDVTAEHAMRHASEWTALVSATGCHITTETGAVLASIDQSDRRQHGVRVQDIPGVFHREYTWHATDLDGGRWQGMNTGPGQPVTLRRLNRCVWQNADTDISYCHRRATRQGPEGPSQPWCAHHARHAHEQYGLASTPIPKEKW